MKKRFLALLLALCLVASLIPAALAAEDALPEGLEYVNRGSEIEISAYTGTEAVLQIPELIEGLPVTQLGYFFDDCPTVTHLILPKTINYIRSTLSDFPKLEKIEFSGESESYAAVDGVLFDEDMSELLRYPAAKQGAYAVPQSVTYIDGSAFEDCTGLTSLVLPQNYTFYLGTNMFWGCTNLQEITIPAGVTEIQVRAFNGCTSLKRINVDENNSTYSSIDGVLFNKAGTVLKSFPSGISGHYVIPENVRVDHYAFYSANKLSKLTISNNVDFPIMADGTDDWGHVLYGCNQLTEIVVDPAHPKYSSSEGILYSKDGTVLHCCPQKKAGLVTVPEGVVRIYFGAFLNCSEVTGLVLPESLEKINIAFNNQSKKLTDIYYAGTEAQWENVTIDTEHGDVSDGYNNGYNEALFEAQMHYNVKSFGDVAAGSFYHQPVLWAVSAGVTTGTSDTAFSPSADCNRAAVVTFLWRAAGCPEPKTTKHPFEDVEKGSFYEKAVLWAVENNITTGIDDTHFGPTTACNRAQVVTFLYRAKNQPAFTNTGCPFSDVASGAWYEAPILWAVENGITTGMGDGTFGVNTICNRAQVVTFLYRTYVN